MKVSLQKKYTFFDDNALDAARFQFGAESDGVVWHEGWLTVDDLVEPEADIHSGYTLLEQLKILLNQGFICSIRVV